MNNSNINQTTTSQDIQNLTEGEILGRGGNLNDLRERLQHVLNAEGDYHLPIISNTGDRDAFAALNDRLTIDQRKTLIIMLLNNTHYITILKFILNKLDNDYLENFLSLSEVDNTFYTTNNFMNLISWVALSYSGNDLVLDVSRFITQYLGESTSDQILNLEDERQRINENSDSTVDANNDANRQGNYNITRFFNISWRSLAFNIARLTATGLIIGYWIPQATPGIYGWLGATAMGAITSTSANQIVTRDSSTNESNQTIGMALDSIIKIIKDFWKNL